MPDPARGSAPSQTAPRPPEGDWLGTPYLRFERQLPFSTSPSTARRPGTR